MAFSDGVFYYSQTNPNAITNAITPKHLDRPYNDFRIYKLIVENSFDLNLALQYCRKATYSLIEGATNSIKHSSLRGNSERLDLAIKEMNDSKYIADLRLAIARESLWRRLIIPAAIRFRIILFAFASLKAILGR